MGDKNYLFLGAQKGLRVYHGRDDQWQEAGQLKWLGRW